MEYTIFKILKMFPWFYNWLRGIEIDSAVLKCTPHSVNNNENFDFQVDTRIVHVSLCMKTIF